MAEDHLEAGEAGPRSIALPYGERPLEVVIPPGAELVQPPPVPAPLASLPTLLAAALDSPVASPSLEAMAAGARRIVVIVSDGSRADPRAELVNAVLGRLPASASLTLAIANGTHAPGEVSALGLSPATLGRFAEIVNHDARDDSALVSLGTTAAGTPIRINRCVADADLIVATGAIKPHYFAGFGAGAKAIFPGLGGNAEIRRNHLLKRDPRSALGEVHSNPCRADLEEAARGARVPSFLLNVVCDARGRAQGAVAGDVIHAFRQGVGLATPLVRVTAPRSRLVVVSDPLPVSASLYQACKLVAAAAPLLEPGGTIAVCAACPDGTGPLAVVNEGIYELGLRPRLPTEHTIALISDLPAADVARTFCRQVDSLQALLDSSGEGNPVIIPRAGSLWVVPQ